MKKRMIALLLCLCMTLTLLPVQAFADEEGEPMTPSVPLLESIRLYTDQITMDGSVSLEANSLSPKGETFKYPPQPGKTGHIHVDAVDDYAADIQITIEQDGQALENEDDLQGIFSAYGLSLEAGKNITINATHDGQTATYTIEVTAEATAPAFTENPITEEGFKLTPAFSKTQKEYTLSVPADAKSLKFNADPNAGRFFEVAPLKSYTDRQGIVRNGYESYWTTAEHAEQLVPLVSDSGEQANALNVVIGENDLRQNYMFRIVRDGADKVQLTDDMFDSVYNISYDGKPHSADLLDISSSLDRSKLHFAFDDAETSEIEKLSSVTDAGPYYVYVSYDGDGVYAPVQDKLLTRAYSSGAEPLQVYLEQAHLTVVNNLPDKTLTLPYSTNYNGTDQKGIDISGLTVKSLNGSTVAGTWQVYTKDQPQTKLNCEAIAYFVFADKSMEKNYRVDDVDLTLNTTKRTLSGDDIDVNTSKWDEELNYAYPYDSYQGRVPSAMIWQLAGDIPQNGTYGSSEGVKEYEFYKVEYSILDKDGNPVEDVKKNSDGTIMSGPKEVGEYKLRVSIPKSSLHSILDPFVEFKDNAEDIHKDIPYKIVPAEICPKAELQAYTYNNGKTSVYPRVTCTGLDWNNILDTVFKVGDKVIAKEADGYYSSYELTAEDTGLVTFSISLKDDKKGNYILSKDSVTEAIYNPNGTPLTPVASSDAKVVHTYDDDRYSVPVEEFSGTITLQGLPAGKNVFCKISDISLSGKGPGELTATVRLTLTGADAGEFVLANSTITVPATVNGINLSDADVQVSLSSYGETFYPGSDGNDPFEPRVSVFAPSGRKLPDSCYKVTYLNNTLPSVLDRNGDGLLAKVIISGVEGGPAYGSVTEEFRIYLSGGAQASELYTMEKGGKKELLINTRTDLELKWDDHGAIDVKAESPVNGQVKVTIEALRSGEAILMAKGTNYYEQDFYYLYGITVTDKDAPAESIPSTVFARTSSDPIGMVRANRVSITAQAGTGQEESGLGVVRPVTVSGQIYPIDKDGYKFTLSAVPGYDQVTGYKVVTGKTAGALELPSGSPKALDENVTNGRPGMSRTFTAATPEALKALTGTLVRLQWYNGSTPLGQPETYRLNFDGLQAKSDIGIEYVNVYSYDDDSAPDRKLGIDNDIIATADDASSKIIFKGKAPTQNKQYYLYIRTTMGGSFWQDITIKPGKDSSPITYEFTKSYSGSPELTDDKQSFYILNKSYAADLTDVQTIDYVAAPVTSGNVAADVRNMTEDQVKELNEVISESSSVGLTAALAVDGKIESAPIATDEHKAALKEVVGNTYKEENVKSVIQPYLNITVTGYETTYGRKTLAVNIDAMCRTIVTTAADPTTDNAIKVEGETADGETANAIKVGTDQKVTVDTPVEISLKLPSDFITVSSNNKLKYVYVKHTKGPNEYYYYATIDSNGVATFTSTHGLSPFELQADFQPEASVQAPNAPSGTAPTYFETLKEAIEAAEDGDIIEINKPITSTSITANINADKQLTFKLATGVMAGDPLTINGVPVDLSSGTVDAVIKKDSGGNGGGSGNGSGGTGGGGGGSTTPSKTYEVKTIATANGKITVSPQSAAKDSIVTITATPDKGYEVASVTVTDASGKAVAATEAGNGKYTFTMPGSAVTVSAAFKKTDNDPPTPPVWKNPFSDVKESDWFIDAVKHVNQNDLMVGTGNKFSPRRNLTRAEFAQILYKKAGSPSVAWTAKFKDVKENDWFAGQIIWAANEGVLAGYGNGTARPRNYITREELVSLLWRYENEPAPTMTTLNFPDANKVSTYAKEAMLWAAENGILEGRANGTLDPRGSATRAEAAQMLMNYFSKKK